IALRLIPPIKNFPHFGRRESQPPDPKASQNGASFGHHVHASSNSEPGKSARWRTTSWIYQVADPRGIQNCKTGSGVAGEFQIIKVKEDRKKAPVAKMIRS